MLYEVITHHFRNGDLVANRIFDAAAELGVKDLRWFPSAAFPCHESYNFV